MKKAMLIFILGLAVAFTACSDDEDDDGLLNYGNWCGPAHTMDATDGTAVDSLDSCCRGHDSCYTDHNIPLKDYADCKTGDKMDCDVTFVECMDALSEDVSEWETRPIDEEKAEKYRTSASALFKTCKFIQEALDLKKKK